MGLMPWSSGRACGRHRLLHRAASAVTSRGAAQRPGPVHPTKLLHLLGRAVCHALFHNLLQLGNVGGGERHMHEAKGPVIKMRAGASVAWRWWPSPALRDEACRRGGTGGAGREGGREGRGRACTHRLKITLKATASCCEQACVSGEAECSRCLIASTNNS